MTVLERLNPTPEDWLWLRPELYRRAAEQYEIAQKWVDAAECWALAGKPGRAAELNEQVGNYRLAGEQYLASQRYDEMESCYRIWLASLPAAAVLERVQAHLGIAAAIVLRGQATGSRAAEEWAVELATPDVLEAKRLVRERDQLNDQVAGQCWEELARYGLTVTRGDLVQVGYEKALDCYGERFADDRQRALVAYEEAVEWNKLLLVELAEEAAQWQTSVEQPVWHPIRQQLEELGFSEGKHDVLHFVNDEKQLALWQELAVMENDPDQVELDDYLRSLAPEQLVYIPAGTFQMGSGDDDPLANDNEKPQHEVWLGGYYIGKYPVTNAEYGEFMAAGGYAEPDYWTEAGWARKQRENWSEPRFWQDSSFNGAQQPVVGVSWYEVVAYSKWRKGRLPTEAEWEKAASLDADNQRKRRYPWGDAWDNERGNWGRKVGKTTDVGAYPGDASAYGLLDVGGNVEEWCSTRWSGYPYQANDGREELEGGDEIVRVLRSGWGWWDSKAEQHMRCAYRYRSDPRNRDYGGGLRFIAPRCLLSSES